MILLTICILLTGYLTNKYLKRDYLLKVKSMLGEILLVVIGFLSLIFLFKKDFLHIVDDNKITSSIISFYILWIGGLYSSRLLSTLKLAPLLGNFVKYLLILF